VGGSGGSWTEVQPEQIRAFREEHTISRNMLASTLGVSATSVQNWETGLAVAMPAVQARLASIIQAGPGAIHTADGAGTRRGGGAAGVAALVGHQVSATGMIVNGFLTSQSRKFTQEELIELIKTVRGALGAT
jgi:DNA-binding XRE family transcriptional regulator